MIAGTTRLPRSCQRSSTKKFVVACESLKLGCSVFDDKTRAAARLVQRAPEVFPQHTHKQDLHTTENQQCAEEYHPCGDRITENQTNRPEDRTQESGRAENEAGIGHQTDRDIAEGCDGIDHQFKHLGQIPAGCPVEAGLLHVENLFLAKSHPGEQRQNTDIDLTKMAEDVDHGAVDEKEVGA